jgi:hypothetical protein
MPEKHDIDSDDLWRRVGLDELRQALARVENLSSGFEKALRTLPPCNTCARVSLLEQIQTAGRHLSSEAASLSVLAGTLKQAVSAAEKMQAELATNIPEPCQCSSGKCICHDD